MKLLTHASKIEKCQKQWRFLPIIPVFCRRFRLLTGASNLTKKLLFYALAIILVRCALSPHTLYAADTPRLPNVLLIGDSISIDYTPDTIELLKGKVNVHRPACNCMFSGHVAANINKWMGKEKWDIVHFNAGIWDCHFLDKNGNLMRDCDYDYYDQGRIRTSQAQYKANLNKIVDAIILTGAKPIFATTTTIPGWNDKRRAYLNGLNEIAKDLMFYKQIQVNDLYSYSLPYLKQWQLSDHVHFNPLGKKQLAKQVSAEILKALGSEAKVLDWMPKEETQTTIQGRDVICYNHNCLKRWGYEQSQNQFFYVMIPGKKLNKNPLVVFLHSAGGNAKTELEAHVRFVTNYGDEFVGLLLNSPSALDKPVNGSTDYDWWWGEKAIKKHPHLYENKMTPVENRVLDTIEWVIQNYNIDRNRVYLRGVSMGGSGTLGIGLAHGDIFAALRADVFAGVDHAVYRLKNATAEPPYVVMLLSQLDSWSKGFEQLLDIIPTEHLGTSYAWDIYGHDHRAHYKNSNPAVVNFPWLSIRRNQAYPVFTNTSSDDKYPGHMSKEPDQKGQVNAYFRWSVLEDTVDRFIIELRTVNQLQFVKEIKLSASKLKQMQQAITSDVTLRRLQNFMVSSDTNKMYNWTIENDGKIISTGQIMPNSKGLLTVNNVETGLIPIRLIITAQDGNTSACGSSNDTN